MDPAIETRAQGGSSICSDSSDYLHAQYGPLGAIVPSRRISRGEVTQVGDVAHISSIEGKSSSL
jgi:hypothetical protein